VQVLPILAALRRNRVGAILIGLQIALTLAIVCNSLSIIEQRLARMHRPSGIDEADIFTLGNAWVIPPSDPSIKIKEDLAALRGLPGVVDATPALSFPLRQGGWSQGLFLQPNQPIKTAETAIYTADEHGLNTFGFHLVGGRWFSADEIVPAAPSQMLTALYPKVVIVTQALAQALYPSGSALGKPVFLSKTESAQIIGIIDRAQVPWVGSSFSERFVENATFLPFIFSNNGLYYVVRTQPGRQAEAMHAAEQRLLDVDRGRDIERLWTFSQTRERAYRSDRALSLTLVTVCALLLTVTALGIVGLTTYWVAQRRRQIGVRRALGARRVDILRYFQTENLLIVVTGGALGIALALAGNLWLVTYLEVTRMSLAYVLGGAAIVLALSQLSVIWPAIQAASLSPSIATRTV
jgi:putative ABC transport system permease protein